MEMRNQEIDVAIRSLSSTVEAMSRRVNGIDDALLAINVSRQDYIIQTAQSLMPEISKSVLNNLRNEVPAFVTAMIENSFGHHKKFLGIFSGKAYEEALTLMQTRLASHLDQIKYGNLKNDDMLGVIAEYTDEKRALNEAIKNTLDLIKTMQQVQKSGVELPPQARDQIHAIAKGARTGRSLRTPSRSEHSMSYASTSQNHVDDDFDLLFYIATDIPTSLRTLMIDAISDHQVRRDEYSGAGGSFGGGGASSEYSTPAEGGNSDSNSGGNSHSFADSAALVGSAAVIGGAAVVGGAAILTDDSLGNFS